MSSARPWPCLPEEDSWALELMEERLRDPWQTPEQLQARAEELRVDAAETEIEGIRAAVLVLADRYRVATGRASGD